MNSTCSCGEREPHIVAYRETADSYRVELWDNGAVTGGLGYALSGVPIVRPRTEEALSLARAAGWLFAGEVAWVALADVGDLYAACRAVATKGGLPGDVRADLGERIERRGEPRLRWQVYATNSHGDVTVRYAVLPRLRWGGLVIVHERGRYELQRRNAYDRDQLGVTGWSFGSLREVFRHLREHTS